MIVVEYVHTADAAGVFRKYSSLRVGAHRVPRHVLFAHCYRRSARHMRCLEYKLRWLTRRLPHEWVYAYVKRCGPWLHRMNEWLYRFGARGRRIAYEWVPYYHYPKFQDLDPERLRELEQLNAFDALTPSYDDPMTTEAFRHTIESEGFVIEHLHEDPISPVFCTTVKRARTPLEAVRG